MKINGENYKTIDVFKTYMTVPDCFVLSPNKLGGGHGEAKFYISPKELMYDFYGKKDFTAKCFMLKSDLITYMDSIKNEYMNPSQEYKDKDKLPKLWNERLKYIESFDDVITFDITDQSQIKGERGYVNSKDKGYQLIRQISLPQVSYIYVEKLGTIESPIYYWKLFVDFDAIGERKNEPLVFTYGKEKNETTENKTLSKEQKIRQEIVRKARIGQGKYRELLLRQCPLCPFTMISDARLLIASHIKPWAACESEDEQIDPYNGYALSPLYDRLFDQGFITFTKDKKVILSKAISSDTWKLLIKLKDGQYINALPMDDKRIEYLNFHYKAVFKGNIGNE